jgi:hypothetical protein
VLATSKVPLLETVPFEIKVPLTESKVPLIEAVLFEIKVPLAETKVPLAKSIVPLFEIGVLLSERKLVWVVTSGAPTIVWLTYLMVPYTLAVDKHGIFTTTLVLFLPAHSGAVLLTHDMVLFVQLTVLLLAVGTTDQTRSCHHTHQPTIAGTKRCGISWTHSCCISNTTDDSFLLNILTLGYCIGVVVVVMDGVVVVPRSVPIVERLMGVGRSIEFR